MNLEPKRPSIGLETERVARGFCTSLGNVGYRICEPTSLVSRTDPTVRFIGSTISVLKPFVLSDSVPSFGLALVQPAIRTQALSMLRGKVVPSFPSYFLALGALRRPDATERLALDALQFLEEFVGLSRERIAIRVSSRDRDLVLLSRCLPVDEIEVDGYEQQRFRHVFGVQGLYGRNVNFAVRSPSRGLEDIGNLIIMERDGWPVAVEVAFGVSVLLARRDDQPHPMMTSPIADVLWRGLETSVRVQHAIALEASIALTTHGIRPQARGRGRILREYLLALASLNAKAGYTLEELLLALETYDHRSRSTMVTAGCVFAGSPIHAYLSAYLATIVEDEQAASVATTIGLTAFSAALEWPDPL